jgi:hypothetical protein
MGSTFQPARQAIAALLCAQLLLPALSRPAQAAERVVTGDAIVTMEIGQPSVWSLAQAHYFLAQMHKNNTSLATRTPDPSALDPNQADASRLATVQTLLGAEARYDQALGAKNRAALQSFRDQLQRRDQARADLEARKADLAKAKADQEALDEQVAALTTEDKLADAARGKAPATPADIKRKSDLAVLTVRRDAKKGDVDALGTEVSSLSTAAAADVAAPAVSTAVPADLPTDLPSSDAFKAFATSALNGLTNPRLSASIALDNFVGMQYEIVAKQLSLLRDEVGPDERVIFLELPTSIYTVDRWADDYVAQVDWKVTDYYDQEPDSDIQNEVICEQLESAGELPRWILETINGSSRKKVRLDSAVSPGKLTACVARQVDRARQDALTDKLAEEMKEEPGCTDLSKPSIKSFAQQIVGPATSTFDPKSMCMQALTKCAEETSKKVVEPHEPALKTCEESLTKTAQAPIEGSSQKVPITLAMVERQLGQPAAPPYGHLADAREIGGGPRPLHVRALEIIPHQSAINVNESTAAVHGRFFRGILGLLNGLGLDIVSRSQSELYQRFVQQEVFASGFGKGGAEFGWTFGPQPGTKRIAPGQRTTYAVLAVPKGTLAIALEATGRSFKRRRSPDRAEPLQRQRFLVGIPGERTEQFWVTGIDYAPVAKGAAVTALIDGRYFSPQLGVLVDGVPLRRALSITRAGGDEQGGPPGATGVDGEFEITNSREIALRFSMGKDYVGTPSITLVSPERSNGINRFSLELNHGPRSSLADASRREPMFIEAFDPEHLAVDRLDEQAAPTCECPIATLVRARLTGAGLRPRAQISINGQPVEVAEERDEKAVEQRIHRQPCKPFAVQETTSSYFLYVEDPGDDWKLRYLQPKSSGFDAKEIAPSFGHPFAVKVRHYRRGVDGWPSRVFLSLTGDKTLSAVHLIEPRRGRCFNPPAAAGGGYQITCELAAERGPEPEFLTLRATGKTEHLVDVDLPVRPRVIGFKNPRTGKPSGYADEQPVVFLEGVGLPAVTGVLFGSQTATLSSPPGSEVLTVQVPKAEVAAGEEKQVPILLQLKDGQNVPSGAAYLFLGAPLPKLLLCGGSPCRPWPGGRHGS